MKNKRLVSVLLLTILLLGSIPMFIPVTSAVIVNPGTVFSTYYAGGPWYVNYTVSHPMNFSSINIGSDVTFNTTEITLVTDSTAVLITMEYLDNNPLTTIVGDLVLSFNYSFTGSEVYFMLYGFKPSNSYRVTRNNVNWSYPVANGAGLLIVDTFISGTVNIDIYDYLAPPPDTTKPAVTINFAGNHGDKGGPYWLPPGESTALSGVNLNGYYTNDSYQNESWLYINTTCTDNIGVTSVKLHWLNATTNKWFNTSGLVKKGTSYWEINTSVNITNISVGHKYSFDIWAYDAAGNIQKIWWNKTTVGGGYTRRYVILKTSTTDISYTPLYVYNKTEPFTYIVDLSKKDRLHHDQGLDGTSEDTGYLLTTTPTDETDWLYCTGFVGAWFDCNIAIKPFTLTNIYYHVWYSTDATQLDKLGWYKTRDQFDSSSYTNYYTPTEAQSKSEIYWNGPSYLRDYFNLTTNYLSVTNTGFTDNNIYELVIKGTSSSFGNPTIISNRSFTSFILFNVPSNTTLNASYADSDGDLLSDWTELYQTFTNPFLSDTDNDNQNDSTEYYGGSDPNNYTSIGPYTAPALPVVVTNDATFVEETTAQLNGLLVDDGGGPCNISFQYGETMGYGTTISSSSNYYNQTTENNYVLMATGGYATRIAYNNVLFTGKITSVSWHLRKSGWPTGNLYSRIRYASNDTIIAQSSTILDSSTVASSSTWYSFIFTNNTNMVNENIYITLEYTPTHSGLHFIWCSIQNSPLIDCYYYISPTYTLTGTATIKVAYEKTYSTGETITNNLINILRGTLYHYRITATNSNGTSYGFDKTFLTKPNAPIALTIANTGTNNNQILSWTHGTGYNHTILRARVDGPYPTGPTTDTSIYNDSGTTRTVNNTFLLPGRLYYYRAWEYAAEAGLQQYSDSYTSVIGLTKPYAPRNTLINRTSFIQANLTWTKGTGSNNTIIRYKATGYPTSRTDGVMVYNGTGTHYITTLSNMTIYYFTSFSFTKYGVASTYSDNKTDFTNVTGITSAFIINCYDEETNDGLTFNVLITSPNGSQTYNYTGCTNPQIINASLCPQGTNIQIVVSSTGYHYRTYTQSIYPGIIYTLNAYLPKETPEGNGTHDCYQRPYIDSKTIDSFVVDQVITFTHPLDEMISVEIYNASLYGTYGGWLFVSSTKFFFNSSCVTINKSVLDINTTMARVNYYYQFCTGDIESALYYIRVVETIETDYIDTDRAVENAFIVVKRYNTVLEEFVIISSMYTDANGYINLYLIPNILYKIFISKSGYTSVINDYIPAPPNVYGQTIEKVFRMTINYGEEPGGSNYDDFSSTVVFTATMNSSDVVQIYYFDRSGHTINTSIYFYSWYEGNSTLLMSYNRTAAQSFYWNITGLNHTRMYIAVLYFNTTNDFNIPINRITITVYPLGPFNNNTKFDIEDRITDVFGPFKIGPKVFTWIGVFLSIIPLIILTLFDPANVGIGILTTGFFMAGVQVGLAAWTINSVNILTVVLTPVVIFIGVLYIFAQRQGYL